MQTLPPHTPLESTEDRRDAVRRRAAPVVVSITVVSAVALVVCLLTYPILLATAFATFGVGLVVGRRL